MTQSERPQIGHSGHTWENPWPQHNLLKLLAGHSGHSGHTSFAIFINVFHASPENRSRNREKPLWPVWPLWPAHNLNIYYIIILYIYICILF